MMKKGVFPRWPGRFFLTSVLSATLLASFWGGAAVSLGDEPSAETAPLELTLPPESVPETPPPPQVQRPAPFALAKSSEASSRSATRDNRSPSAPPLAQQAKSSPVQSPQQAQRAKSPKEVNRDGAELLGIIAGKTTMTEIEAHPIFKKPVLKEVAGDYFVLTYRIPDLPETPYIQLMVKEGVVEGMVVHLGQPRDITDARTAFAAAIENSRPIVIPDRSGHFREIYPERGFVFILDKDEQMPWVPSSRVIQVIAETIKPDFFVIRAAQDLKRGWTSRSLSLIRSDAEEALRRNPESAAAHWVLGQVAFLLEDYDTAQTETIAAIRADNSVPQYHFSLLKLLDELGKTEEGLRYLEAAVDYCSRPPFGEAESAILRGDYLRDGDSADYDGALREHRFAVDALLPLMKSEKKEEKTTAGRLIFQAYLALALDIAKKEWPTPEDKEKAFLWIAAAAELASKMSQDENFAADELLDLCQGAVRVGMEIPDSVRVDSYIDKVAQLGEILTKETRDPLNLQMIYWKCGKTLFAACQIAVARQDQAQALVYAKMANICLHPFLEETPERVVAAFGSVDYELATILLTDPESQKEAFDSFDRAVRTIELMVAANSPLENGENGIRLANIGKAFWNDGQKERGAELTRKGISLIEKAVEAGAMERTELLIPCQNLVTMFSGLENRAEAEKYLALARWVQSPDEATREGMTESDAESETAPDVPPQTAARPVQKSNEPN